MALPESDQRELVCADRECGPSRLSCDPARALVGSEERILGAYFARLPLSAARARAPGGERLTATASGPTAVIVRRLSKNKSIQAKLAETQAHMGSS